mmetsp:Transcript_13546/g.32336  ORF Transcript_13546/g.32336 Transcript_13546/m.32336 type:complete len:475 (-) Transcript_13546:315-1739(-)
MPLGQFEAVKAELHSSVDRVEVRHTACLHVHNLAILQLDTGKAPHVPELRNLRMHVWRRVRDNLIGRSKPAVLDPRARIHQELGEHRGLCELAQMEDDTLPLSDEVEVAREGICEPPKRMSRACNWNILQAVFRHNLLASLNAHLDARDQCPVGGKVHLSLLYDKPLSSSPRLVLHVHSLRPVEDAEHAHNWHCVLSQSQLLQKIVCLEHHIADARPRQPLWLKAFLLRSCLHVLRIHRVQGEERLPATLPANLERQGKVLEVNRSRWLVGRSHPHGAGRLIPDQAGQPPEVAEAPLRSQRCAGGDEAGRPANVMFGTVLLLLLPLLLEEGGLLILHLLDHDLCTTLRMDASVLGFALIRGLTYGHEASRAKRHLFSFRVHVPQPRLPLPLGLLCLVRLGGFDNLVRGLLRFLLGQEPWEGFAIVTCVAGVPRLAEAGLVAIKGLPLVRRQPVFVLGGWASFIALGVAAARGLL